MKSTTAPPAFEQQARQLVATVTPAWGVHQQPAADMTAAWTALHDPDQPWTQHLMRLLDAHARLIRAASTLDACAKRISDLVHGAEHETWERRFDSVTAWLTEAGCAGYSWTEGTYAGSAQTTISTQRARIADARTLTPR